MKANWIKSPLEGGCELAYQTQGACPLTIQRMDRFLSRPPTRDPNLRSKSHRVSQKQSTKATQHYLQGNFSDGMQAERKAHERLAQISEPIHLPAAEKALGISSNGARTHYCL